MTKNTTTTNKYRIPADRIQNLEIDRNGRIAPRLHDLEPLENTLLSVLYPESRLPASTSRPNLSMTLRSRRSRTPWQGSSGTAFTTN